MKGRAPALLCLALLSAALFSSCSYLLGDPYGDFAQKTEACVNLRSEAEEKEGWTLSYLPALAVCELPSGPVAFAFAVTAENSAKILALSFEGLGILDASLPAFGSPFCPALDSAGRLRLGGGLYDASGFAYLASCPNSGELPLLGPTGSDNLLLSTNSSNQLAIAAYTGAWAAAGSYSCSIDSGSGYWLLARAATLPDGRVCLVFFKGGSEGWGSAFAVVFADAQALLDAMASSTLVSYSGAAVGSTLEVASVNGGIDSPSGIGAWPTADGLVAVTGQSNGRLRLARYPLGPGGEIDEYSVASGYRYSYCFEASGGFWLLFDRSTGWLFKLRSWWR